MQTSFWWYDTKRLYIRYVAAGLASIPAAVAYAYLAEHHLDRAWPSLLLAAVGVALGSIAWNVCDRSARLAMSRDEVSQTANTSAANWRLAGGLASSTQLVYARSMVQSPVQAQVATGLIDSEVEHANASSPSHLIAVA